MAANARMYQKFSDGVLDYTTTGATTGGALVQLVDGRAALIDGSSTYASGDAVAVYVRGVIRVDAANGVTFADGAPVYWDNSASTAINSPAEAADMYLGPAKGAKASATLYVDVDLNACAAGAGASANRATWTTPAILMDHADTAEHVIVLANENPLGLKVLHLEGIITEVMAGNSEDQLIVGLYDEDDNLLDTLTPTNGAADAVGDIVKGPLGWHVVATGGIPATIPAGKAAYIKVSQATAGTSPAAAGAYRVSAEVAPLL